MQQLSGAREAKPAAAGNINAQSIDTVNNNVYNEYTKKRKEARYGYDEREHPHGLQLEAAV